MAGKPLSAHYTEEVWDQEVGPKILLALSAKDLTNMGNELIHSHLVTFPIYSGEGCLAIRLTDGVTSFKMIRSDFFIEVDKDSLGALADIIHRLSLAKSVRAYKIVDAEALHAKQKSQEDFILILEKVGS